MIGLPLFDHAAELQMLHGDRAGETFDRARDRKRLDSAMELIFAAMRDRNWHTLRELADKGRCSEACASARIRDLRKREHGQWKVERNHIGNGLWAYRWTGEKA